MSDIVVASTQALSLDVVIQQWAHSMHMRSQSTATLTAYNDCMTRFRRFLHANGLELDTPGAGEAITAAAQAFASMPWSNRKQMVAGTTYNQRLAILSSFYTFAISHGYARIKAIGNPLASIERARVQDYAGASAIEAEEVRARLATIDRSTIIGKRDYAILAIALQTGRRLQEILNLRHQDISVHAGTYRLMFPRTKGGKTIEDELPLSVSAILADYLSTLDSWALENYRDALIEPDQPIWRNFSRYRHGRPLGAKSLANICEARLGTSKVHATRHTFAHQMEREGATVGEIQRRLQHSSLATTTRYLSALTSHVNSKANDIAAAFGF